MPAYSTYRASDLIHMLRDSEASVVFIGDNKSFFDKNPDKYLDEEVR